MENREIETLVISKFLTKTEIPSSDSIDLPLAADAP